MEIEKLLTEFGILSELCWAAYNAFRKAGFDENQAMGLTIGYMRDSLDASRKKPPEEDA